MTANRPGEGLTPSGVEEFALAKVCVNFIVTQNVE
jgi:hypothetical protein